MRRLTTLLLLLAATTALPVASATTIAAPSPPEQVCFQTVPVHFTQYHCAGLDEKQTVNAAVLGAATQYHPYYRECVTIDASGPTWVITVTPDGCIANVVGLVPVRSYRADVDLRPLHVEANVGSIPSMCDAMGKLCDTIATPAVCPAWGCEPLLDPCPATTLDVCVTSDAVQADVSALALADVDRDGHYDGVALRAGRSWVVLETVECHGGPTALQTWACTL